MDKTEFLKKIEVSTLSAENKKKITILLTSKTFDADTKSLIKEIIQNDIDETTVDILTESDKAEIKAAANDLDRELADIQAVLAKDIALVDSELADLDKTVQSVGAVLDDMRITSLKATLAK